MEIANLKRVRLRIVPRNACLSGLIDEPVLRNSAERPGKERHKILHPLNTAAACQKCRKGREADEPRSPKDSLNRRPESCAAICYRVRRTAHETKEKRREIRSAGGSRATAAADSIL